jgi:hypothetical protein
MLRQDNKLNRWDDKDQENIKAVLMQGAQGMYILLNALILSYILC